MQRKEGSPRARLLSLLVAVAAAVAALDQISKSIVVRAIPHNTRIPVVPGLLDFTCHFNRGALFGSLQGYRIVLLVVTPLIGAFVVWYYSQAAAERPWTRWGLILVLGGAIGNFLDRIHPGAVIDFILFHWYDRWEWYVFNVADSAITIGVMILVIDTLREFREERKVIRDDAPYPH